MVGPWHAKAWAWAQLWNSLYILTLPVVSFCGFTLNSTLANMHIDA